MFPVLSMTIGIVFLISGLFNFGIGVPILQLGLGMFLFGIGFVFYRKKKIKTI